MRIIPQHLFTLSKYCVIYKATSQGDAYVYVPREDFFIPLLSQLEEQTLVALDLLLKLDKSKEQSLGSRGTARDVNIDGNDPIASSDNRIGVVVVSATVGTGTHTDDPPRLRHLIVHLAQGRGHLIGQRTGHDHHIRLTRTGTEHHTETLHVVSGGGRVHHLDGAAGQTEGHGPEGALAGPVDQVVDAGYRVLDAIVDGNSTGPGEHLVHPIEAGQLQHQGKYVKASYQIHRNQRSERETQRKGE